MNKKEIKEKIILIIKNYLEENGIDAQDLNEKSNLMKDYDVLLSVEQLIQYVISNKTNV